MICVVGLLARFFTAVFFSGVLTALPAQATVNQPFASHPMPYAAGTILPDHVGQTVLDQSVADFYDLWKARYVQQDCGNGRYYVRAGIDASNLTVSEAHGYGMVITVLMAGHDPDAQSIFDGMFAYYNEHPTIFHTNLMAWYQNKSCKDARGVDSASDGDLDIALALLLADKQWGSCGAVDYATQAQEMIADIKDGELDANAEYILLGDWVTPDSTQYYSSTRSSDFMPDHYRSFEAATGDAAWSGVVDRGYQMISVLQTMFSPVTGLLPDFVEDPAGVPHPAPPDFLEGPGDGSYDFNACRDPWRIATDYMVTGDPRAKAAVQAINTWVQAVTAGDPASIKSGYQLDGTVSPNADFIHLCFSAPLAVSAMVDSSNQSWLNSLWDFLIARPIDGEYYGDTLKMMTLLVVSGNWWTPESVAAPACVPAGNALCSNPAAWFDASIRLKKLSNGAGKQGLVLRGSAFFPSGSPAVLSDGAQILVEDLGSGGAALFDLSQATAPVPASAVAGCDTRDGWKVKSSKVKYRNKSGALDVPFCTPGSANGLRAIRYRTKTTEDVDLAVKASRATIATPVGPLRATLVFGDSGGAGISGKCAMTSALVCESTGRTLRCR